MTKLIWITGATGFIGGAAARRFATEGWRVIGFDRRRPEANLPSAAFHVAPIEGWILEAAIGAHGKPDAVFHAAGTGTVGQAQADPAKARHDTVETTAALVDTLSRVSPNTRVIYPSSAAVYGNSGAGPLAEGRTLNPASIYGRDKQDAEGICLSSKLSVAIIRFFSVYGPGLRKQLPWELAKKLIAGPGGVTLFGTGQETRDFLNIEDAVGLIRHLTTCELAASLIVNGGTGVATTVANFARLLADTLSKAIPIAFSGETKQGDPMHLLADISRLTALPYQPQVSLKSGLAAYADWVKAEIAVEAARGDK